MGVEDTVPEPTGEVHFPLWFAFLFTGKLLYNFAGDSGLTAVVEGANRLGSVVDGERPFAYNGSMLGVLADGPLRFVPVRPAKAKKYVGTFVTKGDSLLVDTKIAWGDEDYFHRAAIDAAFEHVRLRLGRDGGIVCAAALWYFGNLAHSGCGDLSQNLHLGAAAAAFAAVQVAQRHTK